jgi:hypothetical protein
MRTTFSAIVAATIALGGCAQQRQREAMEAQQNAIIDANQRLTTARLACYAIPGQPHAEGRLQDTSGEYHFSPILPVWRPDDAIAGPA